MKQLRKSVEDSWRWLQSRADQFDQRVLTALYNRSTLIAAMLGVVLCAWGLWQGDVNLILQVVLTGAIAYVLGFIPATMANCLFIWNRWIHGSFVTVSVAVALLQFVCCTYIAWLGYQHHRIARARRQKLEATQKPDHVIPWTLVNEVRNSLLALRLLLFQQVARPIAPTDYKLLEDELLRLELLFGTLSQSNELHTVDRRKDSREENNGGTYHDV